MLEAGLHLRRPQLSRVQGEDDAIVVGVAESASHAVIVVAANRRRDQQQPGELLLGVLCCYFGFLQAEMMVAQVVERQTLGAMSSEFGSN